MFVLLHAILEQLQDGMTYYEAIGIVSQPLTGQSNTDMLQQAYQGQVQNILRLPPSVRDFCLTVLLWVQNSSRPLRFCELLDVLSLLHRKRPNASSDVPRLRTLHDVEFHLLRHCTILLSLQNDTADFRQSILHLAHFSVKEFLQTTGCFETSRFHNWRLFQGGQLAGAYMAKACLEYLLQPKFSRYPAETTSSNSQGIYEYKETFGESLRNDCPFYDYAATFWARHLDMSCSSPSLVAFLDPNNESSASNRTTFADPQSQSALDTLTWVEQYLEVVSPRDEAAYQKFLPTDPELSALCLDFLGVATTIGGTSCNYRIWRHYHLGVFNGESDGGYLPNARDSLTHLTSIWSRPDGHPLWRILDFMLPSRLLYLYGTSYRSLALQSRLLEALCLQSTGLTAFLVTQGADINFTWPDNHTTMELYIRRTTGTRSPMFFYTLLTHFCAKTLSNKPIHAVHIPVGREVFRAGGGGWINPRLLWGFLYGNALQRKVLKASHFEREEWDASGSTDLEVIRTMIAWYIEVNNRSLFFPSAVHAAVLNDQAGREQLEMLDLIFENEGDANAGPWLRPIGTFLGIDEGDLTLRESLCEMFLQLLPSSGISHGRTFGSLLRLIEHNPHFSYRVDEIISKVLSEKALRYNSAGWIKSEQLSLAVRRGDKEAVESMLAKGINVNRCGTWYGSALYVAAYTGNKDLVQLLLRHNADPNIAVESRILPLELERDFGWAGLWRRSLSREDASYTPLQAAASRDHTEIVQTLLQHGADVNHNAQQSGTALYFAMCNARPHYQATEWSQERRGGDNLPYWRALNGRDRINSRKLIDLLLEHGADVNLCGGRYCTPLQVACVIGEVDLITVLLRKGADPNLVGGEEGTALQAALTNFPDPDPEAVKKGQTLDEQLHAPLIPPSFYLYSPILARCAPLMHEGWNVEALAAGQPPDNRALAISQLLLDHGADPTLQAGPWGTAIHAAAYFSSVEVLALILDSRYSDPTARRTAANTHSQAMGVALNGPAVTARYDKVTLLLQHASAEFYWHSLLKMRLRRVGSNAFMRVKLLLAVAWAVRDFLVFIAVVAGATSVAWPIYTLWNELDAKCWEWDPRLGGLWMLFSILAAGWVTNVRDSWANDTAW
jgi:ankyrin repeat protein